MKISDLKNYKLPIQQKEKISFFSRKKKSVSNAKVSLMSFIDFTLCTILRVIFGFAIFQFLIRNVPIHEMQTMHESKDLNDFLVHHKLYLKALYAFASVFALGSLYYILLISKTEKGTIGAAAMSLRYRLSNGERPSIFNVTVWYLIKSLYPFFGFVFLFLVFTTGIQILTVIFLVVTMFLSSIPSMVFGIRTFAEVLSGINVIKCDK